MKKLFFILPLIFLFSVCKEDKIDISTPQKDIPDSVRIESISYKIRNGFGDLNNDFVSDFSYESQKLVEITNYAHNKYDLSFTYIDEKVSSRSYFDLNKEKLVAIDSFIYNTSGRLKDRLRYNFDEDNTKYLTLKTKFHYNSSSQIIKMEDYKMPEEELASFKEYTWAIGNIEKIKYEYIYFSSMNIEEIYQYDQSNNYLCLNNADIDIPTSINNIVKMDLIDEYGIYEGIYELENKIEYNEFDLPVRIISYRATAFDIFNDTIIINYLN